MEFNVANIKPIVWNDEAFQGLVLAADRKNLLRSLVDAHNADLGFDDFIQGKGQGLIINLFGPPGVGKTLSAEATSEHVHRPLYVVGGGDLGTKASKLDLALERVFDIATTWKAIVLIDEVRAATMWQLHEDIVLTLHRTSGRRLPRAPLASRPGTQCHGRCLVRLHLSLFVPR